MWAVAFDTSAPADWCIMIGAKELTHIVLRQLNNNLLPNLLLLWKSILFPPNLLSKRLATAKLPSCAGGFSSVQFMSKYNKGKKKQLSAQLPIPARNPVTARQFRFPSKCKGPSFGHHRRSNPSICLLPRCLSSVFSTQPPLCKQPQAITIHFPRWKSNQPFQASHTQSPGSRVKGRIPSRLGENWPKVILSAAAAAAAAAASRPATGGSQLLTHNQVWHICWTHKEAPLGLRREASHASVHAEFKI